MIKIRRVRPTKYRPPKWWEVVESWNPDLRPNFLNDWVINNPTLVRFLNWLPHRCPFNQAYEAVLPNGKYFLICYIPRLCKVNPFFDWIIDLKLEVFNKEKIASDLTKLDEIAPDREDIIVPSVQSILKRTNI